MDTWDALTDAIATALRRLGDDEWVTLTVPARDGGKPEAAGTGGGGLLGRLFGRDADARSTGILVQLRRQGTYLYAECTGGPAIGGEHPWTDTQHSALLGLGWNLPPQIGARVYVRHFPADDGPPPSTYADAGMTEEAAALAVRTVRDVYGLVSPDGVELTAA